MELISLDEAARLLLGDASNTSVTRSNYLNAWALYFYIFLCYGKIELENTLIDMFSVVDSAKVRRLYDIANVLSSMNLIEKVRNIIADFTDLLCD